MKGVFKYKAELCNFLHFSYPLLNPVCTSLLSCVSLSVVFVPVLYNLCYRITLDTSV